MKQRIDIHGFDYRLLMEERHVEVHNPISDRNAELIRRFESHCFSEGLGKARVVKYLQSLRRLGEWLGKDFDKADRADIERVVSLIERSEYSAWTKHDYKVALKRFYLWLGGGEEYPPLVRWVKTTFKEKDAILPEELLTEDEVMRVVEAADSLRDKAFVMALYESGARIGELGSLRVRDVAFEEG